MPTGAPSLYRLCPRCEAITKTTGLDPDFSEDKAARLARAWGFFNAYEEREQRRRESGAPSPEEIGIAEARALIDLDRQAAA